LLQDTAPERARIYVFGSALRIDRINDVDVAVVTDDIPALREIQAQLSSDHDLHIVDLVVLSTSEEKELDFLRTVGAVEVSTVNWMS
jgi:predicted nucleotidyltransferase